MKRLKDSEKVGKKPIKIRIKVISNEFDWEKKKSWISQMIEGSTQHNTTFTFSRSCERYVNISRNCCRININWIELTNSSRRFHNSHSRDIFFSSPRSWLCCFSQRSICVFSLADDDDDDTFSLDISEKICRK